VEDGMLGPEDKVDKYKHSHKNKVSRKYQHTYDISVISLKEQA
jgi:hypothetical protein